MKYDALIVDLDGTLYKQFPVRVCMALWLAVHYILRPHRIRELFLLKTYRKLREECYGSGRKDFDALQINEAARLCGISTEYAKRVITSWMIHKPLKLIKIFRRRRLLDALKRFQKSGKIVAVYSDYPVREKLCALNFKPDYSYWSNDGIINCMKPNADGLMKIIQILGTRKNCILYIGDREDRDGECARKAGIDYLDVKNFKEEKLS